MSYGPNISNQCRRAAELVDKILRGTKPGDIPVGQPTKFDLVINPRTENRERLFLWITKSSVISQSKFSP